MLVVRCDPYRVLSVPWRMDALPVYSSCARRDEVLIVDGADNGKEAEDESAVPGQIP